MSWSFRTSRLSRNNARRNRSRRLVARIIKQATSMTIRIGHRTGTVKSVSNKAFTPRRVNGPIGAPARGRRRVAQESKAKAVCSSSAWDTTRLRPACLAM